MAELPEKGHMYYSRPPQMFYLHVTNSSGRSVLRSDVGSALAPYTGFQFATLSTNRNPLNKTGKADGALATNGNRTPGLRGG